MSMRHDIKTRGGPSLHDNRLTQRHAMAPLSMVVSFLALGFWSFGAAPLPAEAGGTIIGQVLYSGKVPPPKKFAFKKFPNTAFCSKNPNKSEDGKIRLLTRVRLAKGGGLQDALVAVRGLNDDTWMKAYPGTKVVADLCEWSEFTGVAVNRGRFIVENNDADPDDP
ncbi:MAG: hypothetical protein Q8S75_07045, partial [Nitrospirota bacterium]|nr:hypothetical protein [Nitrospirota bacterium]